MAVICPTVLAANPHDFKAQIDRLQPFAGRIHIDLMDGKFAKPKSISPEHIWWPPGVDVDLHVMYKKPFAINHYYESMPLRTVIVHAEAKGDFMEFAAAMKRSGKKVGVALLAATAVDTIAGGLEMIDHVLIFSGHLGHFGGKADPALLPKIKQLRALKPSLEIGWDGGINDRNAAALSAAGIDVLNVGGYIQHAENPTSAYRHLESVIHYR